MSKKVEKTVKARGPVSAQKAPREVASFLDSDRSDDPLFVPHLEALGLSAEREATPRELYAAVLETICGAVDDSQPVEQYNGALGVSAAFVTARQAPVCQVQWNANLASIYTNPGNVNGVRWGSGTMISDDLMLTAGHLFDQTGGGWNRPRVNGTSNVISAQDIARNMHVNFNYQVDPAGNLRAEQSFPIVSLIEYRLGSLDFAICRIGGNPGATFGRTAVSSTDAAVPDMLCIIGHPAGLPKRIEAGPTTLISGNTIQYNDIDTLGGNSGSGILRASDGRLVGIHTNGGCSATSPAPGGGNNYGQRIAAVIAASPTLRSLLRPTIKEINTDPLVDAHPTRKEIVTDPISDQLHTRKELIKDPLVDPLHTRKELAKDPLSDPFTFREGIFDPNPNLGRVTPQTVAPFVMAINSRAPEVGVADGGADAARARMQEIEQAIEELEQQHAELIEAYAALAGMAGSA